MIGQKTTCDKCKAEINGDGYSVSFGKDKGVFGLDIIVGVNQYWEHHFCGRQCLILAINELVDKIEAGVIETPTAREEHYEDHVAA